MKWCSARSQACNMCVLVFTSLTPFYLSEPPGMFDSSSDCFYVIEAACIVIFQ